MFTVHVRWVDADKTRASFTLPGRLEWSAEHVSALIQMLSEIRAEMSPSVPVEPPPPYALEPLHDPRYATELHPFSGGTMLELRHPALGWFEFVLPSRERARMSALLAAQESQWRAHRR
ncbi:MAG TPA: hypothetical protein VM489_15035 [Burkholderiales bacterium]|nr:hypothetical protein [Burkholderiales bacterium]